MSCKKCGSDHTGGRKNCPAYGTEELLPLTLDIASSQEEACTACERQFVFKVELSTGLKMFCSEGCYAHYAGIPHKPEGYYGLVAISSDGGEGDIINTNSLGVIEAQAGDDE